MPFFFHAELGTSWEHPLLEQYLAQIDSHRQAHAGRHMQTKPLLLSASDGHTRSYHNSTIDNEASPRKEGSSNTANSHRPPPASSANAPQVAEEGWAAAPAQSRTWRCSSPPPAQLQPQPVACDGEEGSHPHALQVGLEPELLDAGGEDSPHSLLLPPVTHRLQLASPCLALPHTSGLPLPATDHQPQWRCDSQAR
ncbi:MAG: hypothetical protein SGPRY_011839, partial [Prymnesium sp.]